MIYVLSGGQSGKNAAAVINVQYPSGSVCTCTGNGKTLKAPNTLGGCAFFVPEAGTWTVSCTNGDKTASKSVTITAQGQIESVELTFSLILFANGTFNSDSIGGLTKSGSCSIAMVDNNVEVSASNPTFVASGKLTAQKAIDVTRFTTMKIFIVSRSGSVYSALTLAAMNGNTNIASLNILSQTPNAMASLSLENVTGEVTFVFDLNANEGSVDAVISEWYLE